MALPDGWPPRVASGVRSIRFFVTGTGSAAFADHAYLFAGQAAANTYTPLPVVQPGSNAPVHVGPPPMGTGRDPGDNQPTASPVAMIWSGTIRLSNDEAPGGTPLEFSFDGSAVHGKVLGGESVVYRHRYEAGIAVRGVAAFRIEAW